MFKASALFTMLSLQPPFFFLKLYPKEMISIGWTLEGGDEGHQLFSSPRNNPTSSSSSSPWERTDCEHPNRQLLLQMCPFWCHSTRHFVMLPNLKQYSRVSRRKVESNWEDYRGWQGGQWRVFRRMVEEEKENSGGYTGGRWRVFGRTVEGGWEGSGSVMFFCPLADCS